MRVVTLHAQDYQSASLDWVLPSLGCYIGGVCLEMIVKRAACAMSVNVLHDFRVQQALFGKSGPC